MGNAQAKSYTVKILSFLRRLLFPPRCRVCGGLLPWEASAVGVSHIKERCLAFYQEMAPVMCGVCMRGTKVPEGVRCSICGVPIEGVSLDPPRCGVCMAPNRILEKMVSLFLYEGGPAYGVRSLKYHNKRALAPPMGRLLYGAIEEIGAVDLVVPVPLHLSRLRKRGFNQASLLCEVLEKKGYAVAHDLLLRRRNTDSQAGLSRKARLKNVQGAFEVKEKRLVKGRTILLVDDVLTTGSTLSACGRVLRSAGAESVSALAFARRDTGFLQSAYHKTAGWRAT